MEQPELGVMKIEDPKGDHSTHGGPTKGNISLEKCSDFSRDELPFKSCCTFPSVTGAFHLRNPKRGKDVKLYNWLQNAPPQGQKIRTFYKAMALSLMGTMFCY